MRHFLTWALVTSLCILVGWAVLQRDRMRIDVPITASAQIARGSVPTIGQPAPDFTLPALHHDPQSLTNLRGQPVLINFWASWCGPCRREMPDLIAAYEQYRAAGLVILAVNLAQQDSRANAEAFAEEFQIPFPVLLDNTSEVADDLYGARALPMSFFIDPAGNVRHIYVGGRQSSVDRSSYGRNTRRVATRTSSAEVVTLTKGRQCLVVNAG